MAFVVIGTWSGYRGPSIRHVELVEDDSLKPKYDALQTIVYTDGTYLDVSTKPMLGYKDLLDSAIRQGLTGRVSVTDFREVKRG